MAYKHVATRYQELYAKLLHLYPQPYRQRFGEGMAQTFNDLCRERQAAGEGLFALALWVFAETSAGIMRERRTMIMLQNKSIIRIVLVTAFILLLPLVAMQFTDEVVWDLADFAFAGALLIGAGLTYAFAARQTGNKAYRAAVGVALGTAFILIWVNGAVGIIGSENNDANLMYGGVLAVGIIGVIIARSRPQEMSTALFATAIAQALVPIIALIIWKPQVTSWGAAGVFGVFVLNAFFVMLFVGSALLFRNAAREQTRADTGG